ncbi:MAG: ABC transporter ATP-binding protein [Candidatus Hinthialibacter antarcticus]|nr:ABC transporter ATP-binding protein [Candidatus Hinthialibacter antarcticus]
MNDLAPILSCQNIRKIYRSGDGVLEVLKGLHLSVNAGEFVAITGESGSGKSTLLHLLGCLDEPSEGTIDFRDQSVHRLSERERDKLRNHSFGFVFQFHHLLAEFNALENVALPGLIANTERNEVYQRAEQLLIDLRMKERLNHRPNKLSGGEQQRVAVARALINQPALLLMDEPTGNLDAANSEELISLVKEQQKKYELTVILVTHDPSIAAIADRKMVLVDGNLA